MNVEQAREVFHAAHESLLAIIEQLQMPQVPVCQAVKIQGCIQKFQDITCKKKFAYLGC